jgi:hypothetical protein
MAMIVFTAFFTPHTLHHTLYSKQHTPYPINHILYITHHTPYLIHHTPHTPHTIRHTSHTPHAIRHTLYSIHHTPYATPYTPYQDLFGKDLDLDWTTGTVNLEQEGRGECEGGGYRNYGHHRRRGHWDESEEEEREYSWTGTESSTCTLTTDKWGKLTLDTEEDVHPEDYFDGADPDHEEFDGEDYGGGGYEEDVSATRSFSRKALVVWPRSLRWMVTTEGDFEDMVSDPASEGIIFVLLLSV